MKSIKQIINEEIKTINEGMEIGVNKYDYNANPQTILDLSHVLYGDVANVVWDKMTPEEQSTFRTQVFSPDGNSAFQSDGVLNFYAEGLSDAIVQEALGIVKQSLSRLGIKLTGMKEDQSQMRGGRVIRISLSIPEKDAAPSFHASYGTMQHLLTSIGIPMGYDQYSVTLPVDPLLQRIEDAERKGLSNLPFFRELKMVATWAKNNGYKTIGGA